MNRGFLTGRLGADVEVRTSANDNAHARLRLAENYYTRSADGEGWDEQVAWHTIVVFGKLAQSLRCLGKGSLVLVEYRLQDQVFEKGDVRITYSQPVAQKVEFLAVKKPVGAEGAAEDVGAEPGGPGDGEEDES